MLSTLFNNVFFLLLRIENKTFFIFSILRLSNNYVKFTKLVNFRDVTILTTPIFLLIGMSKI